MGQVLCFQTEGGRKNKKINKKLKKDKVKNKKVLKLLLLGTGESGKSTIFKQAQNIFEKAFAHEKERKNHRNVIYSNLVTELGNIYDQLTPAEKADENTFASQFQDLEFTSKKRVSETSPNILTSKEADVLLGFWKSKAVQKAWSNRQTFQVFDTLEYFMQDEVMARIATGQKYIPTFEDVIHARSRTTGIEHQEFKMERAYFRMYDVGGQRSERRKWLHCFDDVKAVIFVVAMNEFNQSLFEDEHVNRLEEALSVWRDIVNREEFSKVAFLLFLNKEDLFKKKLEDTKFCIPGTLTENYGKNVPGNTEYESQVEPCELKGPGQKDAREKAITQCAKYIEKLFKDNAKQYTGDYNSGNSIGSRIINVYRTTATRREVMASVFKTCEQQVLSQAFVDSGFAR
eukprot:maker-scaffold_20-snap-gene-4.44-mRNA-1 protein AED:0.00 eAED:0.00 QI:381/1/1/1/1/1/2/464/400